MSVKKFITVCCPYSVFLPILRGGGYGGVFSAFGGVNFNENLMFI